MFVDEALKNCKRYKWMQKNTTYWSEIEKKYTQPQRGPAYVYIFVIIQDLQWLTKGTVKMMIYPTCSAWLIAQWKKAIYPQITVILSTALWLFQRLVQKIFWVQVHWQPDHVDHITYVLVWWDFQNHLSCINFYDSCNSIF